MLNKYKILVTDNGGNTIVDLSDRCLTRNYKLKRNRASQINLLFDLDDLDSYFADINQTIDQVFSTNVNEIHVYRYGTEVVSGQINFTNVEINSRNPTIGVVAVGWLELFSRRLTALSQVYTTSDIGEIMWSLIDLSQTETNGDFGITEGSIETSRDADRSYELKNIKDALIQLSEVQNSVDFEFTPDKVFNVFYPKQGQRKEQVVFIYPGNIIDIGYTQDGQNMANQVIASGSGTGSERLLSTADDTVSREKYKLRQAIIQFPDVSKSETLDSHAEEELRTKTRLLNLPEITINGDVDPMFGEYGLGDEVLIKATKFDSLLKPVLGYKRIDSISVSIDQENLETVRLSLDRP